MSNDIQPAHVKLDSPTGTRPRVIRAPGGRPAPTPKTENRGLKIELAYLKELRRLRLKEQQNNKHESFITSEKNSD